MFIAYPGRSYQVTDTLVSGHIVANKSIWHGLADDQCIAISMKSPIGNSVSCAIYHAAKLFCHAWKQLQLRLLCWDLHAHLVCASLIIANLLFYGSLKIQYHQHWFSYKEDP